MKKSFLMSLKFTIKKYTMRPSNNKRSSMNNIKNKDNKNAKN